MTTLPLSPHKREVLRAWLDGRTPQKRVSPEDTWEDFDPDETAMVFGDDRYRIKPTPTRRFWRPEEIPVGWQVREVSEESRSGIILGYSTSKGVIRVEVYSLSNMHDGNFDEFEVAPPGPTNSVTWVPAGVEE